MTLKQETPRADARGASDGATKTLALLDHSRGLAARCLAYLFAAGAATSFAMFLLLPQPGASMPGTVVVVCIGVAVACALELLADRIPLRALPAAVSCGILLATAVIYWRAAPTAAHGLLYLWVSLYSFFFFSRAVAFAELALAAAAYAFALASVPHPPEPTAELWAFTVAALIVAGATVAILRSAVQDTVTELASAARTDPLTGLLNRRAFEETFELELERARRTGVKLSVLIGDLDRFKEVNDRFGHSAGDQALGRVSEILQTGKRRIDTVGRLGGEEFALIAPDTSDHHAFMLAERLRSAIAEEFADEPVPLTISFGVASVPDHGDAFAAILGAADDALYAAKELGRDRTVIYSREVSGILAPAVLRGADRGEHLTTLLALTDVLDIREPGSGRHSRTVGRYAELTAQRLGLPQETVERVRLAGMLHDVGKIALSSMLLTKPGPLSDDEWDELRRHSEIGARILAHAQLGDIAEWVLAHHERPDGQGFPFGVAGADIPLEARILAVVDAYEAMTSRRPYREAMPDEEAREELRRNAGSQFDELVVESFLACLDERVRQPRFRRSFETG